MSANVLVCTSCWEAFAAAREGHQNKQTAPPRQADCCGHHRGLWILVQRLPARDAPSLIPITVHFNAHPVGTAAACEADSRCVCCAAGTSLANVTAAFAPFLYYDVRTRSH